MVVELPTVHSMGLVDLKICFKVDINTRIQRLVMKNTTQKLPYQKMEALHLNQLMLNILRHLEI